MPTGEIIRTDQKRPAAPSAVSIRPRQQLRPVGNKRLLRFGNGQIDAPISGVNIQKMYHFLSSHTGENRGCRRPRRRIRSSAAGRNRNRPAGTDRLSRRRGYSPSPRTHIRCVKLPLSVASEMRVFTSARRTRKYSHVKTSCMPSGGQGEAYPPRGAWARSSSPRQRVPDGAAEAFRPRRDGYSRIRGTLYPEFCWISATRMPAPMACTVPGRTEKYVAGVYRHAVEHLADRAVLRPPPQLVRRHGARKAEKERALRPAVHHIPHLRLALLALFAAGGRIRRMYLNGKVPLRVYQFDEQRERRNAAARARHTDGIGAQDIRQTHRNAHRNQCTSARRRTESSQLSAITPSPVL